MNREPQNVNFDGIFRDDELVRLVRWFKNHHQINEWFYPAFYCLLILCTGMRKMECATIKLEHIASEPTPLIYLPTTKNGKARTVEILPHFEPFFLERFRFLEETGSRFLFTGKHAWNPVSHQQPQLWWERVMDAVKIRRLSIKAGRASFATYAPLIPFESKDGTQVFCMSMHGVQAQLGHSSITTTAKYYYRSIPGTRFPREGRIWSPNWPNELKKG
jgi:integrase